MSDILALAGRASVCAVHSNKCFGSTESLACWLFWAPLFCLGVIVFVAAVLFIVYSMPRLFGYQPPRLLLMLLRFLGGASLPGYIEVITLIEA